MLRFSIALLASLAVSPLALAADKISLTDAEGTLFHSLAAGPKHSRAAVLLVHDWFGLSPLSEAMVDRLGAAGYSAVAVDLYKDERATDHANAERLMKALDQEQAQKIIAAAASYLSKDGAPIAIVGFSMGGKIALQGMLNNPTAIKAAAIVYGGSFEDIPDETLKTAGPVLVITGSNDDWAYSSLTALEDRMRKLGNPIEAYVFPGMQHAYAQKLFNAGKNYNEAATKASMSVLDNFIARQVEK
jgi:carboxymethylenebutenolidase